MKGKWQFHPNHNVATLHIDKLLPDIGHFQPSDEAEELRWALLAIPGVSDVSASFRYQLFVIKGEMFSWDEIIQCVDAVISDHFGEPFEAASEDPLKPRYYIHDGEICLFDTGEPIR